MFYQKPIFFNPNRVFRVYTGGKLLGKFLEKEFEDDFYPEEWIASDVRAMNEESSDEYEGISKIEGEDIYFNDAIKQYKKELLGDYDKLNILVKYLDSAVRLPIQAHPTKEFSRKHFNSNHGKEESWYILDTRPDACVYYGFKEGITKEIFMEAIEKSETDKTIMESLLVKHSVKKGDMIYIPAKTVHAIGAGCLILEVQEPTDFTIQPERWCADYKLSDYQMYLGLSKETSMECFDFTKSDNTFISPKEIYNNNGVKFEELINDTITTSFNISRITLSNGKYLMDAKIAVYIVTEGEGIIYGNEYTRKIKQGDYFFLPASADNFYVESQSMTMLLCK